MEAILILGHGSRKSDANNDVKIIAKIVQKKIPQSKVEAAFLSFEKPSLEEGVAHLIELGADKITVVPLFLFSGNHVKRDIPDAIDKQKENYPQIEFRYTNCLGTDHRIAEIVLDRIREVD